MIKVITGQSTLSLSTDTRREMEEWVSSFKLAFQRAAKNFVSICIQSLFEAIQECSLGR